MEGWRSGFALPWWHCFAGKSGRSGKALMGREALLGWRGWVCGLSWQRGRRRRGVPTSRGLIWFNSVQLGLIFGWIILGYVGVDLGPEAKEPAGLLLGQSDALFFEAALFGFALGAAQFCELLRDGG
jgi:hypothetical protein